MSFWERLKKLMHEHDLSQRDMEGITGLKQPSISRWQFGTLPKADIAIKLARHFNMTVEELILGNDGEGKEGEVVYSHGAKVEGRRVIPFSPNQDSNIVHVPFYEDAKASAGSGYENEDYTGISAVPVLRPFIGHYNPNSVRMLEVAGDSMTGIHLFSGDLVFFVPTDTPADGLNVIAIDEKLFVKRLEFDVLGQEIRVISENDRYSTQVLRGEDMNRLRVVGKVIGWITRHPY